MVSLLLGGIARRIGDPPVGGGIVGSARGLLGLQVHRRVVPVDHPGVVKMQPEQRSEAEGHATCGKLGPARQGEELGQHDRNTPSVR